MKIIKKIVKYLGIFLLLGLIYVFSLLSSNVYRNYDIQPNEFSNIKIVGHRGACGLAPENTLASINEALKLNLERMEIDVHQTKDGHVILMHDLTLDRTTNGTGNVKDMDFQTLRKLDAGNWFDKKYKGEQIPTLEEVIDSIHGRSELIIEMKKGNDMYPGIEEKVAQLIKEKDAYDWCIVHSFDTNILKSIHALDPKIRLHKVFFGKLSLLPIIVSHEIENYDYDEMDYIEEYSFYYKFAKSSLIADLKKQGKKVNVWTVNDIEDIEDMIHLGIDGVITDFPNLVIDKIQMQ